MWISLLCFSQKISSYQGGQGQNYSSYTQPQSSYYGSNNSVAQGGYYSQWGGYDQYSGYNSSYNSTYNTGYNTGYNSGYNYNYGYGYPPPGHMPPPPIGMPPMSTDMSGVVEVRPRTRAEFNIFAGSSWKQLLYWCCSQQNHEETGAVEEETADGISRFVLHSELNIFGLGIKDTFRCKQ